MRDDIDFREKYISSLEEQIVIYRGQHHTYCSQIQKLKDNIRNLEEQLIEFKKRKLSPGSESSEHVDYNRYLSKRPWGIYIYPFSVLHLIKSQSLSVLFKMKRLRKP